MSANFTSAHLFLIGYRGSGKTTLAGRLSNLLQMPLVDTDRMVEETTSKTIAQIFSELGENEFRDREARAVDTVCRRTQPHIISLGGGAILRDANRQLIKNHGWTAWLAATPEELARRISGDPLTQRNRPALSKLGAIDEINTILQSRTPHYSSTANAIYNTEDLSLDQLTAQVAKDYEQWLHSRRNS